MLSLCLLKLHVKLEKAMSGIRTPQSVFQKLLLCRLNEHKTSIETEKIQKNKELSELK